MKRVVKIYLILCLTAFLLGSLHAVVAPSIVAYVSPKAEEFTELYFEDHLKLPFHIASNSTYYVRFTIHNVTTQDQEYPYKVFVDIDGNTIILSQQTVVVKKDEYKTIQVGFFTAQAPLKSKFVVQLLQTGQHVDFLMDGSQ